MFDVVNLRFLRMQEFEGGLQRGVVGEGWRLLLLVTSGRDVGEHSVQVV